MAREDKGDTKGCSHLHSSDCSGLHLCRSVGASVRACRSQCVCGCVGSTSSEFDASVAAPAPTPAPAFASCFCRISEYKSIISGRFARPNPSRKHGSGYCICVRVCVLSQTGLHAHTRACVLCAFARPYSRWCTTVRLPACVCSCVPVCVFVLKCMQTRLPPIQVHTHAHTHAHTHTRTHTS